MRRGASIKGRARGGEGSEGRRKKRKKA